MNKLTKLTVLLTTITTLCSGCSVMKENQKVADDAVQKTQDIYGKLKLQKSTSLISRDNQVYLTGTPFKIEKKQNLPPIFHQRITYTTAINESVQQSLEQIGKLININVRISEDTRSSIEKKKTDSKVVKKINSVKTYQGTLEQVLNQITNKNGLYWDYEKGLIKVFQVESKVYALDAPIGEFDVKDSISTAANTSASDSSSTTTGSSNAAMNYNIKAGSPWDAAVATIKNMLSPLGHIDTNPVEGYVTVTDNPDAQKEINRYIKKINDKTNHKIAVRVDVYDVQVDSKSNYGLSLGLITRALSGHVAWISNPVASGSSGSSNGDSSNQLVFQGGSHETVFNALNSVGKATELTGTTVYTISGQPAPIQNAIQTSYLKSVSTVSTSTGTTVSVEPGTVTSGYSMTVTPRIESNNEILISLNLQLSTLLGIDKISVGGGNSNNSNNNNSSNNNNNSQQSQEEMIQLPQVHTKNFLENMILKSGQTLLIAGFQDGNATTDSESPVAPSAWILGGSKNTSQTKSTTVVVVTPYLVN